MLPIGTAMTREIHIWLKVQKRIGTQPNMAPKGNGVRDLQHQPSKTKYISQCYFFWSAALGKKPPMFRNLSGRTWSRIASSAQGEQNDWCKMEILANVQSKHCTHNRSAPDPMFYSSFQARHYNESGILEFLKLAEQHLRFVAEALISGHSEPRPWSHLSFAKAHNHCDGK